MDLEVANFVAENENLIHFEELFQSLPEGFYNSWSSFVLRKNQNMIGKTNFLSDNFRLKYVSVNYFFTACCFICKKLRVILIGKL